MKYFKTFTIICILGLLYSSCVKKANYPDVPVITYNSYIPFVTGSNIDSAYLRVNFTDGNGDIGYPSQQENVPPNFYVEILVYVYNTNTYDSVTISPYNVPYITPTGSDKELNGIIQINFEGLLQSRVIDPLSKFKPGYLNLDNLQFKVWQATKVMC